MHATVENTSDAMIHALIAAERRPSHLIGPALDYWVGKALGKPVMVVRHQREDGFFCVLKGLDGRIVGWSPSTDWSVGGPISQSAQIALEPVYRVEGCGVRKSLIGWAALHPKNHGGLLRYRGEGKDQLQAAMRALVSARYGDYVPTVDRA